MIPNGICAGENYMRSDLAWVSSQLCMLCLTHLSIYSINSCILGATDIEVSKKSQVPDFIGCIL